MASYSSAGAIRREDEAMRKWFKEVSEAAETFERRWTWLSLHRVDPALAQRLREQRDLFDQAMVTGTVIEIEEHGSSMCRGYTAACGEMERSGLPDDAYLLGHDPATGVSVAIGIQKAAAERVVELYGPGCLFVTPDEVAVLMSASADAAHFVGTVKRMFPGAVLVPSS